MLESKSSSITDLPSSMMPAIPSQCLPRTFSPSERTPARACRPARASPPRCDSNAAHRISALAFGHLRKRLESLLFRIVGIAEFVDERVVQGPGFSHVSSSPSVVKLLSTHTRGGSVSRSKWRCRASAAMNAPATASSPALASKRPGSASPDLQREWDARLLQQVRAGAQCEHRLAVPVLILHEFQDAAVDTEPVDGVSAVGESRASQSTDGIASTVRPPDGAPARRRHLA